MHGKRCSCTWRLRCITALPRADMFLVPQVSHLAIANQVVQGLLHVHYITRSSGLAFSGYSLMPCHGRAWAHYRLPRQQTHFSETTHLRLHPLPHTMLTYITWVPMFKASLSLCKVLAV